MEEKAKVMQWKGVQIAMQYEFQLSLGPTRCCRILLGGDKIEDIQVK